MSSIGDIIVPPNYPPEDDYGIEEGSGGNVINSGYIGVINTITELVNIYSSEAVDGNYATVLETHTIWRWDVNSSTWVDTNKQTSLFKTLPNDNVGLVDDTSLEIVNDIEVGGTVDGRDVSVDGDTLDDHVSDHSIHSKWFHQPVTLDNNHILAKGVNLTNTPANQEDIELYISSAGSSVINHQDYKVIGSFLTWNGLELESILSIGDELSIEYLI